MNARVVANSAKAEEVPSPSLSLAARLAAVAKRDNPAGLDEVLRVCKQAIIRPLTDREREDVSRTEVQAEYFDRGFRLWKPQAEGISTYDAEGGLFAPCSVGAGKTLIVFLCAKHGHEARKIDRVLLLVPANGYAEMMQRHVPQARRVIGFGLPVHGLGGLSAARRKALASSGRRGLYVLPYSCLSIKDTDEILRAIRAGLVIADECHELRNVRSAKVRRFNCYMNELPWPQFVGLSGTITNKLLRDFHHLAWFALRYRMPLPVSLSQTEEWGLCIDSSADEKPPMRDQIEIVSPLRDWALENAEILGLDVNRLTPDVSGIRRSFRARLVSSPGVVATDDAEVGTTLVVANRPVLEPEKRRGWHRLQELMQNVSQFPWHTPSGDEIEHAIHTWKWLWELSAGFYNDLTWPEASEYSRRKKIPEREAERVLARAQDHHAAQQAFSRALRAFFDEDHIPGLDTPLLVKNEMHHHGGQNVPDRLFKRWTEMKALEFDDMPKRDEVAVRVCDYKVNHIVEWAKKLPEDKGALVWVHNIEVGDWVFEEMLSAMGRKRVLHCPSGPAHDVEILDPANSNRIVVASISGHGKSKNLQTIFSEQFMLQWPRSAWITEQLLGRLHRPGQEADSVTAHSCHTIDFDHENYAAMLVDSIYEHLVDSRRKVIYCNYDPLPVIYSPHFLKERGFENHLLTADQERFLADQFGTNGKDK